MKRWILLIISVMLVLTMVGCGSTPADPTVYVPSNDPLTNLKNILVSGDKLLGIAFLGHSDAEVDGISEELSRQAFIEQIPFVRDIKTVAENEGNQLFCVIPTDETVTVSVYDFGWDENHLPVIGETLISSNEPFLVRGNQEAYVPNLYLVAEKGNRRVEYQMVRSGIEARLENLDNQMFDFTPYNLLPEFHNLATEEKPLCASWLGDVRDANDVEFALLLYIHESGEARFAFGNSETEMSELYVGTWEIDDDILKLRVKGGKPGYGEELKEKNMDFRWGLSSGVMRLQHIGGDPLMQGTEGKTIDFWSND